jgi:hypothetical protein
MPQSRGRTSKQGPRRRTPANCPEQVRRQQQLAEHLRAINAQMVANGAPCRSLRLRVQATPGYQVILFGEEGYIEAQYSTVLSLPHQGFWLVAIHPGGGRHPSTSSSSNDESSSRTSSHWSMEDSNFPTWWYFENKGSHDNNSSSIATEGLNAPTQQGAGNSPQNHGRV